MLYSVRVHIQTEKIPEFGGSKLCWNVYSNLSPSQTLKSWAGKRALTTLAVWFNVIDTCLLNSDITLHNQR